MGDVPSASLHLLQGLGQHFLEGLGQEQVSHGGGDGQASHQEVGQILAERAFMRREENSTSALQSAAVSLLKLLSLFLTPALDLPRNMRKILIEYVLSEIFQEW